jgi:predicted nucleic acid-binding protein
MVGAHKPAYAPYSSRSSSTTSISRSTSVGVLSKTASATSSSANPSGKLATADALIAATAVAYQLLITRDHDFADIEGIDTLIV